MVRPKAPPPPPEPTAKPKKSADGQVLKKFPDPPAIKGLPARDPNKKPLAQREQRTKTVKAVKICPKCGAFMVHKTQFSKEGERPSFISDSRLRSFGGIEVRTFECEKCHYSGQFQVDPFPKEQLED